MNNNMWKAKDGNYTGSVNYPQQQWWIAALSDEVKHEKAMTRVILSDRVLLYRDLSGSVVALEDRCPHRASPLSMGKIKDNTITCPYHGFAFDNSGKCTKIPSQDHVPAAIRVRAFPTVEKPPFVWIWTGDPDRADESDVPTLPFEKGGPWAVASGLMPVKTNYLNLKENVLDLTHLPVLHADSIGLPEYDGYNAPETVTDGENSIGFQFKFVSKPLPAFFSQTGIVPGTLANWVERGISYSPAHHISPVEIENPDTSEGAPTKFNLVFCHLTTPETVRSTHYFWVLARDYGLSDGAVREMTDIVNFIFAEDKQILELIEEREMETAGKRGEIIIPADGIGIRYRRIVEEIMREEAAA